MDKRTNISTIGVFLNELGRFQQGLVFPTVTLTTKTEKL